MNSIRDNIGVVVIFVGVALCAIAIEEKLTFSINENGNSVANLLTERDSPPGFEFAIDPREFKFPIDHGSHPSFRSEWWYFTGHVSAEEDQSFGFEMTIFRFGLNSNQAKNQTSNQDSRANKSPWRSADLFMAHLAIIDPQAETYWTHEIRSRSALDLGGATTDQSAYR